jgi:metallo-beta-lactamase family protein
MESVYGDRNHEPRETRLPQFEKVINDTLARGGTLVIPAFSVDRSQVLLYELNNLVKEKRIPSVPVYFDSPLAQKVTEIYKQSEALFNDEAKKQIASGDDIFSFPHLTFVESQGESRSIEHFKGAKIILAGSGMSVGGRIISHEAYFLPDPKSTILLVGYQAAGSLGRELADGAKKVKIHGENVAVRAKIETLYGYSAHKDGDHLVEFVATAGGPDSSAKDIRLKQVFVVMGEPGASMHLAQRINDELGVKAIVPERLKEYSI